MAQSVYIVAKSEDWVLAKTLVDDGLNEGLLSRANFFVKCTGIRGSVRCLVWKRCWRRQSEVADDRVTDPDAVGRENMVGHPITSHESAHLSW